MILSHIESEFNNSSFLNMAEQFNITLKTTAAESLLSNGIVKKHNVISAKTTDSKLVSKLDSNNGNSIDVALAWTVKCEKQPS